MENKNVIFIAGCPGAGKDTIAQKFISEHNEYIHLSMGDIYRQIATNEFVSEYRDVLFEDTKQKKLSSAETTTGVVFEAISRQDCSYYIISGFPHHENEIKTFAIHSPQYNISYPYVIFFNVSRKNAIQRMFNRGLRPMESLKMDKNENLLDYCTRRYEFYSQRQPLLLDTLNKAYDIKHIDANATIDNVYAQFCKAIGYKNTYER